MLPDERRVAADQGDGQTSHVERFNGVLRERLARFVRRTLPFSESEAMHDACLRLFLNEYNQAISGRLSQAGGDTS